MAEDDRYQLAWPRDLFRSECHFYANEKMDTTWHDGALGFLEEAFSDAEPADNFRELTSSPLMDRALSPRVYLAGLLRRTNEFREPSEATPYWSTRRRRVDLSAMPILQVINEFAQYSGDWESKGYFESAFGKDCVDDRSEIDPSIIIQRMTGTAGLWPLKPFELVMDLDQFYDLVEVLHDLIARPRSRTFHSYGGCGWHHSKFSRSSGRTLYRWFVNDLLRRGHLGLRLAESGEDIGRLVEVVDDARVDLVKIMTARVDETSGDRVRHAIALFRQRDADEHLKRSAVVALALVLEERRALLKDSLLKGDEGALFQIANSFALRHQSENQKGDYDPVFIDWVFWWYLATIELSDRILSRTNV